jgi:hypothetical protein
MMGVVDLRPVEQLVGVEDPAWPEIAGLLKDAPAARGVEISPEQGRKVLHALQVTARSYLGALALHTGGVLADHGWFRLLGGGSGGLPDLASVNGLSAGGRNTDPPSYLVVGYDVLGGRFAIDGGGLGVAPGEVCYFGPDTLCWGGLGGGHADFVTATITGALSEAFASLRWPGWQHEVSALPPGQGLSLYPPPFTAEGQDLADTARQPVPITELVGFYEDAARQLNTPGLNP